MNFTKRLSTICALSVLLSVMFFNPKMSWGLGILVVSGDENGFYQLLHTNSQPFSAAIAEWPYAMKNGEETYIQYLDLIAADPFLNQSFRVLSPQDVAARWRIDSNHIPDLVLIDSFSYERDPGKRPVSQKILMEKVAKSAINGAIVILSGQAWPFVEYLADKANTGPLFHDDTPVFSSATRINVNLNDELSRILGDDPVQVVIGAGSRELSADTPEYQVLAVGNFDSRRIPVAMEFSMGRGRVIYSAFTTEANLRQDASPQTKRLVREMVARLLKMLMKKKGALQLTAALREENPGMNADSFDLEGADVQELLFCMGRRLEVRCDLAGDVSLFLFPLEEIGFQLLRLGLEPIIMPTDGLRILDVSLYSPDGRLFDRQKVNGTNVVFRIPASTRSESPGEAWTVQIDQANSFSPRTLFMAVFVATSPSLTPGEPGIDPNARTAHLNFISSDVRDPVLKGVSNPASVDVFLGKGGRTTYVGGTSDNVYSWESEGGHYTIVNGSGKSAPSGVLMIGEPADFSESIVTRSRQNLVITLRDENKKVVGSVTIQDWFLREEAKLGTVFFLHGPEMRPEEIEWWSSQPDGELPRQ